MAVTRMYVPEIGQADATARAAALNAGLSVADTADAPRYHMIKGHLPAVVLENGEQIVAISEPTTLAAVDQAATDLEALTPPADPGPPEVTGIATGILSDLLAALHAQGIVTDNTTHA